MASPDDATGGSGNKGGSAVRKVAIVAGILAALAVIYGIGSLVNRSYENETDDSTTSTPVATSTTTPPAAPATNSDAQLPSATPGQLPATEQPAHNAGDDCSHDGLTAQWALTPDGQWTCTPQGQGTDPHQIGDDCSHDGLTAQWGKTPDGQWACLPQGQGVQNQSGQSIAPTTDAAQPAQ